MEEQGENVGSQEEKSTEKSNIIPVSGMYKEWFLDYASYVILERAVPAVYDGLKPVQRRILHALKEMDDGRYNKVANIIGQTMQYHPHGDASIGDALVQIGQKDLLIDCQGNWGNTLTGDRAAAARYIEARLSKFALDVVFNPKTTEWQLSYDGRKKEPVNLPTKFPLLLAQGAEGIAVGMACKMLPHNFNELIDASIDVLRGKKTNILPDFPNGGMADFSNYNNGLRGGKVRVRSRISVVDKKTLMISQIPHGITTTGLIESIIKANDKNKIKIKKIEDNTSAQVEIILQLPPNTSPDKTIDALYAFTDCEISISPNAAVIENDKPHFMGVNDILERSTLQTKDLLQLELEIRLRELQEQWHFASLEKIFIEEKIYIEFDGKTYEEAIEITHERLKPHAKKFIREITDEDVQRLLEIRMRRITKHDADNAENKIQALEADIEQTQHHLDNLTDFAIAYFKKLKKDYGKGRERKTEIKSFENIVASKVVANNCKLYVNKEEGFIGWGLKKDEFVTDCADIDDIIVFLKDGRMMVTKIADKKFIGKNILYAGVWKPNDTRTTYHLIYKNGKNGIAYMKRFHVKGITRDKEYLLISEDKKSTVLYFSANPNGESEKIMVYLRPKNRVKNLKFEYDLGGLLVKGRMTAGNQLSKYPIRKIELKEKGNSTLAARKIWFDDTVQRLNAEGRGELLGEFLGDDKIITVSQKGHYKLTNFDLQNRFDEDLVLIEKFDPQKAATVIHFDGEKNHFFVKRFKPEPTPNKLVPFISEHKNSYLEIFTLAYEPSVKISYNKRKLDRDNEVIGLSDFIDLKSIKALGNRLIQKHPKEVVKSLDLVVDEEKEKSYTEGIKPDSPENVDPTAPEQNDREDGSSQPTLFSD